MKVNIQKMNDEIAKALKDKKRGATYFGKGGGLEKDNKKKRKLNDETHDDAYFHQEMINNTMNTRNNTRNTLLEYLR